MVYKLVWQSEETRPIIFDMASLGPLVRIFTSKLAFVKTMVGEIRLFSTPPPHVQVCEFFEVFCCVIFTKPLLDRVGKFLNDSSETETSAETKKKQINFRKNDRFQNTKMK